MNRRGMTAMIAVLAALLLASLACNAPAPAPTPDLAGMVAKTQTAIALEIFLTSTASAQNLLPTLPPNLSTPSQPAVPPAATSITPPASPGATQAANCTDKAKFEAETIPDDTPFAPGAAFVKTWTLRNVGTCTWTPDYSLVFVKGEQMGGTSPSPVGGTVPPNGTIQIYLPQTAPQDPGEHQGFWKLRNLSGQEFGLGQNADVAFWAKIQVQPGIASNPTPATSLGAPAWKVTFQGKNGPFYLGSDSTIDFDVKDGSLVMTALKPDGDQWRIARNSYLDDFYLEAQFQTGDACSDKDSYGLLVRAPDKPNGVINTGYVFAFSCDGMYRAYRMDSGNYSGIVNWTANPSLKAGPKQANRMGVRAKGDAFQLYANGVLVYEFSDSSYAGGLYGLLVRSNGTQNFQALVKEINDWNNP